MKEILLTRDKVALVDDADYNWLNQWKWHAHINSSGIFYAVRSSSFKDGKCHEISMAREILGLKYKDKRQADHRNHNTLDNRQHNLRICTHQKNQMNQEHRLGTASKFKGVTWNKRKKKWLARIQIGGKPKFLGYWNLEELAALAYDMVAIREFGEFAHLNF